MSLLCSESEDPIPGREKAYAVQDPIGEGYAVGELAIARIPRSERRSEPLKPLEEGLNIYEGVGTFGSTGNWQWTTFEKGKFLFSISPIAAQIYLPRTLLRIAGSMSASAS